MKYFLDFEFIEGFKKPLFGKRRHFIDMISVGIVCEDGRTYQAVSNEWNYNDADKWVQENVILPLYVDTVHGDHRNHMDVDNFHWSFGKSNKQIAREMYQFVCPYEKAAEYADVFSVDAGGEGYLQTNPPEFYGHYCDYDWVLFCSLFGRMIDLPKGFPMYCIDLKQTMDSMFMMQENKYEGETRLESWLKTVKNHPDYPKQKNEHSALADAEWNKRLYDFLSTYKPYYNNQPAINI